uniref:Uncharacterized protein n=1 Tax=Siphoviridae sp. ctwNf2 TaxID=2827597 RepID=A0A8S5RRN8_9CAUD|nr:MAG TPA: hypothetical protein [Siphoviridae sp. ctwNf2]
MTKGLHSSLFFYAYKKTLKISPQRRLLYLFNINTHEIMKTSI